MADEPDRGPAGDDVLGDDQRAPVSARDKKITAMVGAALVTFALVGAIAAISRSDDRPPAAGATVPAPPERMPPDPSVTPTPSGFESPQTVVEIGPTASALGNAFAGPAKPVTEPKAAARTRLTQALTNAVKGQNPNLVMRPVTVHFTSGRRTMQPLQVMDFQTRFLAFAELSDSEGSGQLELNFGPSAGYENPKRPFSQFCDTAMAPVTYCETRLGPGGEHITVERGAPSTYSRITEIRIDVARPDGTELVAVVRNVPDRMVKDINVAEPDRPTPPLTIDQLVAILCDPALTVYP